MLPAFTESPVKSLDPLTREVLHGPSVLHFNQHTWKNDFGNDEVPYRARELFNQPRYVRSLNLFGFMFCTFDEAAQAHFGLRKGYLLADAIAYETKRLRTFITEARDLGVEDGQAVAYCDIYEFLLGDPRAKALESPATYDRAQTKAAAAIRKVIKDSGASRFFRAVITDGGARHGAHQRHDINGWKQNANTTVDVKGTSCVWGGAAIAGRVIGIAGDGADRATLERTAVEENLNQARSCAAVGPTHFGICTHPQQTGWTWDGWTKALDDTLAGLADIGGIELHVFNAHEFPNGQGFPSEADGEDLVARLIAKHAPHQRRTP